MDYISEQLVEVCHNNPISICFKRIVGYTDWIYTRFLKNKLSGVLFYCKNVRLQPLQTFPELEHLGEGQAAKPRNA